MLGVITLLSGSEQRWCAPYLCSGAGQPKVSIFGATFCSLTDTVPADELDAILAELEAAGLVESYTNDQGRPAMRAPVFKANDLTIGIPPEHQAFAEAHFADRPFAEFLGAQHRVPMTARHFHAVLDFGLNEIVRFAEVLQCFVYRETRCP